MEMNIIWFILAFSIPPFHQCALLLSPTLQTYPFLYGAYTSSVITPTQQQYHSQDELGQYAYGYNDHLSSKQEIRRLDGLTQGSYSYISPNGYLQTVDYTADKNGFRAAAASTNTAKSSAETITISKPATIAAIAPITSIASIATSTNTIPGSIQSIGTIGDTISTTSGLRLASGTTSNSKSTTDTTNVRTVELSNSLADTAKIASTNGIYLKNQPYHHQLALPSTVGIIQYPNVATSLIPKSYTWTYPSTNGFFY